ncbi:MAG: BrnT family toxin [Methylococcales bacterium]|jgi:uncharacterized DUF497 family protein|nr:MAG: BrnT family toxin [Methylococcales bacterium]
MKTKLNWDETKRQANLNKHGLDFAKAGEVLESRYRLDSFVTRNNELRMQSISYALGFLAVLTVVHIERDGSTRIISFRHASGEEREFYYDWLKNEYDEF